MREITKNHLGFLSRVTQKALRDSVNVLVDRGIERFDMTDSGPVFVDQDATHIRLRLNGVRYVISIALEPAVPLDEIVEDREQVEQSKALVLTFNQDHRQSNAKLHALHRAWALEELIEINAFLEDFNERSTWTARSIVQAIRDQVTKHIFEDASWFEAAALVQAGVDLSDYTGPAEDARKDDSGIADVPVTAQG